jgi:glycosyltransferase involved in cell wall biosynthesis
MPKVSVVVPNYNHARFLRRRIDTILGQTFRDFELILLDDCSTDESRSILHEYASDPRVRSEFNDINSGSTFKQWNKGVRLAQGKYVWIAESDDYADERLLERLVAVLDDGPQVTFAYCRSWRVSSDDRLDGFGDFYIVPLAGHPWTADFCLDGRELCRECFSRINAVPNTNAVVFRKNVYDSVGGADESLHLCGDWKLWADMALQGSVAYLCEPLNYFRFHDASVRNRTELAKADVAEYLQVCRWVFDRAPVPRAVIEGICEEKVGLWVPLLMSFRTSLALKRKIARSAWAFDPHPMRRALRPALAIVRLKFLRHWREVRSMITAEKYANR